MSFVFYDTEATGINTTFDQILQFAAIRTDHELRELERFNIRCRILPYVVPSPSAMYVTGISVEQLTDTRLPSHYEMVKAIKNKLEQWSPAIFVGHNSLRFDENLLRQALYKTLHIPYLTNTNGNCRSDCLQIVQATNQFIPNILNVPLDDGGSPSFRLDKLAPANGFDHSAAHDAMGDVEATIYLCRLVAEQAADLWSSFIRFSKKAAVLDFAHEESFFSLTSSHFGRTYSWMVTVIGSNQENSSELFVFDLSIDPKELTSLSDENLITRLSKTPKPVKILRANASPCIFHYEDVPEHLRAMAPPMEELTRRSKRIKRDEELAQRLVSAYANTRKVKQHSVHVEDQIYDTFTSDEDREIMVEFHQSEWSMRLDVLERLSDERLKKLGRRLIYTDAPEVVSSDMRRHNQVGIAKRVMAPDGSVPWLTIPKAIREIEDLVNASGRAQTSLLSGLRSYLLSQSKEAEKLLG